MDKGVPFPRVMGQLDVGKLPPWQQNYTKFLAPIIRIANPHGFP
jgi:hypothetical protein